MHILEQYIAALNSGNADQVANLFADECKFNDGGARTFQIDDLCAEGKEGVRAAFAGVFSAYQVKATLVKLNEHSMEYDVELGGMYIPCIGTATCDSSGKMTEYMVRPR